MPPDEGHQGLTDVPLICMGNASIKPRDDIDSYLAPQIDKPHPENCTYSYIHIHYITN